MCSHVHIYIQESLDIQRQIALQKLQQQEAEMAMRFEQQKQLAQMRQMQLHGFPQVSQCSDMNVSASQ